MDPRTAYEHREQALLLDVREPPEWDAGHIAEAVLIPMGQLGRRQAELPTDRRIICVCRSGRRSQLVTDALVGAGYDAVNLEGGMQAWQAARLPIVTDDGAEGTVA